MADTLLIGKKILYVEDDEPSQYLMDSILKEMGCLLVICPNGEAAVKRMQMEKFDLVFMDIRMSKMNGYETSRMIRQTDKNIPIVALTAHVMEWVPIKCRDAGMNGFMPKPCTIKDIEEELRRWLP